MMAMPLGEKSPWKILNVPAAVLTFSDITFLGAQNISHARLANLYSILACSAFHLSLNPESVSTCSVSHWKQVAEQAHRQGKEHMQMSLKNELHEPKKAKYKDQLMAICGMTEFAVRSNPFGSNENCLPDLDPQWPTEGCSMLHARCRTTSSSSRPPKTENIPQVPSPAPHLHLDQNCRRKHLCSSRLQPRRFIH